MSNSITPLHISVKGDEAREKITERRTIRQLRITINTYMNCILCTSYNIQLGCMIIAAAFFDLDQCMPLLITMPCSSNIDERI